MSGSYRPTDNWRNNLERVEAKRGNGLNTLITYRLFKIQYAPADLYVKQIKAPRIRSAMARFCCGVVPINIELGRYFNVPPVKDFVSFVLIKLEMNNVFSLSPFVVVIHGTRDGSHDLRHFRFLFCLFIICHFSVCLLQEQLFQ